MLDANTKNLKVYGLDVPDVVIENLKLDFKKEIASGEKLIIDSDDNITRFFKVLSQTVEGKNNVTYELLMFTFDVAKKAINGNNLVKDEKKIPGFTIDYIFHSLCWAIDNIEKSDVKNLNLTKDVCDLIKQVLNNDGLIKKLTFGGITLMFQSLSSAIEKEDAEKIDTRVVFELVKQVVDSDELIGELNSRVARVTIGGAICHMFHALLDAIKKVGTKRLGPKNFFDKLIRVLVKRDISENVDLLGLDPKNVFELIENVLVKYNTLKNVDLLVMFKILLNVYATDQKQFGNVKTFVEQFGFKYAKNKKELDFDIKNKKEVEQLDNFLNSNSGQRKDLINKFMDKAKINIDFKWAEIDKETGKKVKEKEKKNEGNSGIKITDIQKSLVKERHEKNENKKEENTEIVFEAKLDNEIYKKVNEKEKENEDNSGVNIKEKNKKNENKKEENTEIVFEAKLDNEIYKKVNEKEKENEDNSGVNIKEKNKKNENKKEGNEGVVFEAKTFLQQISNKPKAQENAGFSVDFKNVVANIGPWGQIRAFVWAILFKLGCMLRIFQPNDFSLKQTAQMKELEYVLRCGNLNDKQSAEGFIKRYNLVENNLEKPQTATGHEL